jgi:hypothetical protein
MEASEREPMATTTRKRHLSIVRRYQRRLLEHRVLRTPIPPQKYYVIVLRQAGGGYKYFRYDYEQVWCWSTTAREAQRFVSYDRAESEAMNCSVYYKSRYEIKQIG